MDPEKLKRVALWAGGILILLLIVFNIWTWWGLSDARKKSIEAEIAREKALTALAEQSKQAEIAIQEAEERTARALELAATANANAQRAIQSAASIRNARTVDVGAVQRLTATELTVRAESLAKDGFGESASVRYDGNGFYADRAFIETATKSLIETISLREENTELRRALDEQNNQVAALLELIDADKAKMAALETRINGLENLRIADDNRIVALEKELRAEKRKNLWRKVTNIAITIGATAAGYAIGKSI